MKTSNHSLLSLAFLNLICGSANATQSMSQILPVEAEYGAVFQPRVIVNQRPSEWITPLPEFQDKVNAATDAYLKKLKQKTDKAGANAYDKLNEVDRIIHTSYYKQEAFRKQALRYSKESQTSSVNLGLFQDFLITERSSHVAVITTSDVIAKKNLFSAEEQENANRFRTAYASPIQASLEFSGLSDDGKALVMDIRYASKGFADARFTDDSQGVIEFRLFLQVSACDGISVSDPIKDNSSELDRFWMEVQRRDFSNAMACDLKVVGGDIAGVLSSPGKLTIETFDPATKPSLRFKILRNGTLVMRNKASQESVESAALDNFVFRPTRRPSGPAPSLANVERFQSLLKGYGDRLILLEKYPSPMRREELRRYLEENQDAILAAQDAINAEFSRFSILDQIGIQSSTQFIYSEIALKESSLGIEHSLRRFR